MFDKVSTGPSSLGSHGSHLPTWTSHVGKTSCPKPVIQKSQRSCHSHPFRFLAQNVKDDAHDNLRHGMEKKPAKGTVVFSGPLSRLHVSYCQYISPANGPLRVDIEVPLVPSIPGPQKYVE